MFPLVRTSFFCMWTYIDVLVEIDMKYMYELTGMSDFVCTGERCTTIGQYELEVNNQ
jgi:hypothetical protein